MAREVIGEKDARFAARIAEKAGPARILALVAFRRRIELAALEREEQRIVRVHVIDRALAEQHHPVHRAHGAYRPCVDGDAVRVLESFRRIEPDPAALHRLVLRVALLRGKRNIHETVGVEVSCRG